MHNMTGQKECTVMLLWHRYNRDQALRFGSKISSDVYARAALRLELHMNTRGMRIPDELKRKSE